MSEKKPKKEKCLTCKHPLEEHFGEFCLHYHTDIKRRCACTLGSDGVVSAKKFADKKVKSVVMAAKNFVWFIDEKGHHWRWMYKHGKVFPVKV